ncbi:MAG: ribulose-phosphate 3-epimerase [Gemmatimonadales bacterium]|jgi:ribulose-phosphate 3-epimerase|nr:ribulose-phosphate 3-epimerase [Gemmatimonadales bacterium]MDG2240366.1 ribulose-phosphate 3-epimerase [Longimicrobiales bacterium]NCG34034.1 ribulose-phosphate 3-epimerase [Pseudomonadota bacterium]MBT3499817.1 ribulose-phosphate 3-epimerase [Gemmatimonadales bacterium]MBT3775965.1 ribulose-phosphate 3-epimerase [Gemmatimonadales bacterium]
MKIAPSILSADFSRLGEEIQAVEAGGADWIHVDVMDGHFVPNITIGPVVTAGARRATDLPLDVHLMISNPDDYVDDFVKAGADWVTVHAEACTHLHRTLARIGELGAKAGVALNPATPLSAIEDVVEHLDLLLIMSVNPGFGGQSYIPRSSDKLRRARAMLDAAGSSAELQVDGGVGLSNIAEVAATGASVIVAGSAVYGYPEGATAGVSALRSAASTG